MNILFTCAGRRTYLLKYFKEQLNSDDLIIGADMQLSAPALSVADIAVKVPSVYSDNYVKTLIKICKEHNINLLISLNDLELPILAKHRNQFEEIGVILTISSEEVINICFDKFKTSTFINTLNLNTPRSYISYDDAILAINKGELKYPIVLKPRWGSGSIGIEYAETLQELEYAYYLLKLKLKKSILANASETDANILIQQKIIGHEYGLDIMNDFLGNNIEVSIKQKLSMRAGETDKAVTIFNEDLYNIGKTIGDNLKHICNLDCDILEQDGMYYVLELNPRFGGGFPFSYEAGVNMPKAIIEWAKGNKINPDILKPIIGKQFAKCDYLIETTI